MAGRRVRGQRIFCCNRGQRGGCGRTFSLYLAEVLPRHTVSASMLWQVLCNLRADSSVKAGVESLRPHFALETLYHLLGRFRLRLPELVSQLNNQSPESKVNLFDPLLRGAEDFQSAFAQEESPLAQFQLHFQKSVMG